MAALACSPLAGCATRPPGLSDTPTSPASSPTPDPDARAAFAVEAELAGWLEALAADPAAWGATDPLVSLCQGYVDAHRAHAAWLVDEPIVPLAVDVATPEEMMRELTTREALAATAHSDRAATQTTGWLAMAHASMSASALAMSQRCPAPNAVVNSPASFSVPSESRAYATLIGHVDRLNYAIETGIGRLGADDALRTGLRTRLDDVKRLRDTIAATLRAAGGKPPAVAVSYELAGPMDTPAQIRRAIGECESNVLDAWILVVGATENDARQAALQAMSEQAWEPGRIGYALTQWPGWQLKP